MAALGANDLGGKWAGDGLASCAILPPPLWLSLDHPCVLSDDLLTTAKVIDDIILGFITMLENSPGPCDAYNISEIDQYQ